jgi:hypothetical protein
MYWVHPDTLEVEDLGVARANQIYNVGQHSITEFWGIDTTRIARASHIHPEPRPAFRASPVASPVLAEAPPPAQPVAQPVIRSFPDDSPAEPSPVGPPPAGAAAAGSAEWGVLGAGPAAAEAAMGGEARPMARFLTQESEEVLL